ncbi:MAG TPA: hypothetical protein VGF76_03275 [Polyangiaceae bacterium]
MLQIHRALTVAGAVACLLGCGSSRADCPSPPLRCTPTLSLDLRDPSGNRLVDNVTIVGAANDAGVSANPCSASEACSYSVEAPQGDLMVSAAGYQPVTVHYVSESDSCGYAVNQSVQISLVPENSPTPPTQVRSLGTRCGGS